MSGIRGLSFHSVKGGVGKSTLAVHTALALAHQHPKASVWLVDLDLTGTSLADGLRLLAPDIEILALTSPPDPEMLDRSKSVHRLGRRDLDGGVGGVPFLNDWLLFQAQDWSERREPPVTAVAWSADGAPRNLRVLPSSALPDDLDRTIPAVFDEEYTAFFEARLEHLLIALHGASAEECLVVLDVPPTIPGLSRAVLGVALRLARSDRISLSLDSGVPPPLDELPFEWKACFVASLDRPDLRAVARWVARVRPEEERIIRVVLNRTLALSTTEREAHLRLRLGLAEPDAPATLGGASGELAATGIAASVVGTPDDSLFSGPLLDAVWVPEDASLPVFSEDAFPGSPHDAIKAFLADLGWA